REKLADPRFADGIRQESRDADSAVSEHEISRSRFVRSHRLEQPRTVAQLDPKYAGLLRRPIFVGGFPAIQISQPIFRGPRFLFDPKRIIAIADNLWGKSLVSKDGVALPL